MRSTRENIFENAQNMLRTLGRFFCVRLLDSQISCRHSLSVCTHNTFYYDVAFTLYTTWIVCANIMNNNDEEGEKCCLMTSRLSTKKIISHVIIFFVVFKDEF